MERDRIQEFEPLFGDWRVEETVGQGTYGTVYKVTREVMGQTQVSAVKHIQVPTQAQLKDAETSLGSDEDTLAAYFEDMIRNFAREIQVLDTLSDYTSIIGYKDHRIIRNKNGIGWDILIRMEYLTPLRAYLKTHSLSREQIACLGLDILTALEICEKKGVIHRDIKDDNIFINSEGVFKLGDFGIARQMTEGCATATRGMGTAAYMAPEVYLGQHYDRRADLYSLGIVLYRLLNYGRMPFVPLEKPDAAFERRMRGDTLPLPQNAEDALGRMVAKACAFSEEDRYQNAAEMKRDLGSLAVQDREKEAAPVVVAMALPVRSVSPDRELKDDDTTDRTVSLFSFHSSNAAENADRDLPQSIPAQEDRLSRTQSVFEDRTSYSQGNDQSIPEASRVHKGSGILKNSRQVEEHHATERPMADESGAEWETSVPSPSSKAGNVYKSICYVSGFISIILLLLTLILPEPIKGFLFIVFFLISLIAGQMWKLS